MRAEILLPYKKFPDHVTRSAKKGMKKHRRKLLCAGLATVKRHAKDERCMC